MSRPSWTDSNCCLCCLWASNAWMISEQLMTALQCSSVILSGETSVCSDGVSGLLAGELLDGWVNIVGGIAAGPPGVEGSDRQPTQSSLQATSYHSSDLFQTLIGLKLISCQGKEGTKLHITCDHICSDMLNASSHCTASRLSI